VSRRPKASGGGDEERLGVVEAKTGSPGVVLHGGGVRAVGTVVRGVIRWWSSSSHTSRRSGAMVGSSSTLRRDRTVPSGGRSR
jgi:hypothetical protein